MNSPANNTELAGENRLPVILFAAPFLSEQPVDHLRGKGFQLRTIMGLAQALSILRSCPVDLVILSQAFHPKARERFIAQAARQRFLGHIVLALDDDAWAKTSEPYTRVVFRDWRAFSPYEGQVVAGIAAGKTNRQIADMLNRSEGAIKSALQNIFTKLGVRTRAQVIRIVLENRWKT